jgi:hypothetical protein
MSVRLTGVTDGATCTASASTHTKGSWAQMIASTVSAADHIYVCMHAINNAALALMDVGIGAGGSEQVVIPNLMKQQVAGTTTMDSTPIVRLPVTIPVGTRIATRCQASVGSRVINTVLTTGLSRRGRSYSRATDYGTNTGTTRGTSIDPGAVADTFGTYVQLTASCNTIRELLVMIGTGGNTADTTAYWVCRIGVGAGGAESTLIPNAMVRKRTAEGILSQWLGPYEVDVPAGTRIAATAYTSLTDATDRLADVAVIGFG